MNRQPERQTGKKRRTVAYLELPMLYVGPQCWSPRYNISVILPFGECHPEGLIIASLVKLKVKLQKLCVKIYICVCAYLCIYICMYVCMYVYICIYIYITHCVSY